MRWPIALAWVLAGSACTTVETGAVQLDLSLPPSGGLRPVGMTTVAITEIQPDGTSVVSTTELEGNGDSMHFSAGDVAVGTSITLAAELRDSTGRLVGYGEVATPITPSATKTVTVTIPVRKPIVFVASTMPVTTIDPTRYSIDPMYQGSIAQSARDRRADRRQRRRRRVASERAACSRPRPTSAERQVDRDHRHADRCRGGAGPAPARRRHVERDRARRSRQRHGDGDGGDAGRSRRGRRHRRQLGYAAYVLSGRGRAAGGRDGDVHGLVDGAGDRASPAAGRRPRSRPASSPTSPRTAPACSAPTRARAR